MTDRTDTSAWERLGTALIQRRTELNQRFRNRRVFAEETGLDYRLIYDLEESRRQNFGTATLTSLELGYQLPVGAIRRFLDEGAELPPLTASAPQRHVSVPVIDDDIDQAAEYFQPQLVQVLRERFAQVPVTDENEARVWENPLLDDNQKSALVAWMRWYALGQPGLPAEIRAQRLTGPASQAGWGVLLRQR